MWCVMGMGENVLCDRTGENMLCDGDGRKCSVWSGWEKMWCVRNHEKVSCLVALPSPLVIYIGRLFFGVQEHRKQARPTLNGCGILIYLDKKRVGCGEDR